MNITVIIIIAAIVLLLLGYVIGYLLGWRSGHLTGIDYALRMWIFGATRVPDNEVAAYTREKIEANNKHLVSVKEQTLKEIEELRQRGLN